MGSNYKNDFLKIWKEWGFNDDEIKKLTHFFFYQYGRKDQIKNLGERSEPPHPLLSDVDKLKKKLDTKDNQIEMLKEDIECVHMKLDDYGIPRELNDNTYSINGRINILIDLIKNENK